MLNSEASRFDEAYLERKRQELKRLRDSLRKAVEAAQAGETEVAREPIAEAREYEDAAQQLTFLETAGNEVVRDLRRLTQVERALEKIAAGTYGFSDVSGQSIPEERLEALPEAINTKSEQETSERIGLGAAR
jgi:DnaK suppressor protein